MSIVCGTDFSTPAALAGRVAARIARRLGEPLVLVHVINELGAEAMFAAGQTAPFEPLRHRLTEEALRLRELGAEVREVFTPGVPDATLAAIAGEERARLVVVASVGARAPDTWRLGGVTERLAQTAHVPLLVVRGATPWEAWLRGEHRLTALVGVHGGRSAESALAVLPELRRLGPCDVIAARLAWPPGERWRLGLEGPEDLDTLSPEAIGVLEREVAEAVGALPGEGALRIVVQPAPGRIDPHLITLAESLHADVIVVGTHPRSGLSRLWHGSVANGVLHHAPMSVLIVPAPESAAPAGRVRPFRDVLATTDLSPLGDAGVGPAYAMLPAGGTVFLLHVLEHGQPIEARAARDRLEALVPVDADARGVATEFHVIAAHPVAHAIVAAAERLGADAICMASHGRSGWSEALAGSVAREVLAASGRPVLVVRPPRPER